MKALTIIGSAAAAVVIVVPTAQASYSSLDRMLPAHAKAKTVVVKPKTAVKVAKKQSVAPRVLCICVSGPSMAPTLTEQELEAQANQDAIDHGFPPPYDSTTDNTGSDTSASDSSAG